jgi:hypothetical protein
MKDCYTLWNFDVSCMILKVSDTCPCGRLFWLFQELCTVHLFLMMYLTRKGTRRWTAIYRIYFAWNVPKYWWPKSGCFSWQYLLHQSPCSSNSTNMLLGSYLCTVLSRPHIIQYLLLSADGLAEGPSLQICSAFKDYVGKCYAWLLLETFKQLYKHLQ